MTAAVSMTFLDETIVGVALPSMQRDLGLDDTQVQWVVNAYLLALASLVAVAGRLADIVNRMWLVSAAVVVFVAASVAAGLASEPTILLLARVAQGAASAMIIPPAMALIMSVYPPAERGKAIGLSTGIATVFLSLGPLIGGRLTEIDWRLTFFINVPIGAVTLVVFALSKTDGRVKEGQRFDPIGATGLVVGLVAVVVALQQSSTWGWLDPLTLGLLAFGVLVLVGFVLYELRETEPLIQVRLFARKAFATDCGVLFSVQAALVVVTVFGAIFVQDVLEFSPAQAGLSLLPITLPFLVMSPIAGAAYDRFGPRWLAVGGAGLAAAGLAATGAVLPLESFWALVPGYMVLGVGLAMVLGPLYTDAMNQAPGEQRGEASGAAEAVIQVGGTVGLAVLGTVILLVQRARLDDFLAGAGLPGEDARALESELSSGGEGSAGPSLPDIPGLTDAAADAFTDGLSLAYFIGAGIAAAAGAVALGVLRGRRSERAPGPVGGAVADDGA